MNWYQKSKVFKQAACSGTSGDSSGIYSQYDSIQDREDLAPSMLRKKKKRKSWQTKKEI